jgi:hypothetical protein
MFAKSFYQLYLCHDQFRLPKVILLKKKKKNGGDA